MTATAERGWYYCQGDPEGTVRLWNGTEWVGFPTKPPPGYGGTAPAAGGEPTFGESQSSIPRPLKDQVPLAPYALFAALGLIATAVFAALALVELRSEASAYPNLRRRTIDFDSILIAPFAAGAYARLLIAGLIGGLFFLVWVWQANRNTGAPVRVKRNSGSGFALKGFLFSWNYLILEAIFRTVFGPVITRMFNSIERSTPGGGDGAGLPLIGFVWWITWALSGMAFLISAALLSTNDITGDGAIRSWVNVETGALALHIVSMLCALILVIKITMQQDRRLG